MALIGEAAARRSLRQRDGGIFEETASPPDSHVSHEFADRLTVDSSKRRRDMAYVAVDLTGDRLQRRRIGILVFDPIADPANPARRRFFALRPRREPSQNFSAQTLDRELRRGIACVELVP